MKRKNTVPIHNSFTFDGGPLSELLISKFLHFLWFLLDISCTVVFSGSSCDIKWWRKMKKVCTLHELHISKNIRHFSSQKAEIRCCGWPKFSTLEPVNSMGLRTDNVHGSGKSLIWNDWLSIYHFQDPNFTRREIRRWILHQGGKKCWCNNFYNT